ncbi:response regulator [Aromatoleum petrolei]|uniref:Response regulator n=1 Tax=Aromatoleum petrolei TaxID=76116 RepID=A0ABX1MSV6_9RHOO|nr:response regulator [Aromatoleum petrolei]NMF88212.1 response regulator [Aromatoleum petrolei]QTQ38929.1 Response regulator receiver domain-containing protein [Aromatoleum petrolei]
MSRILIVDDEESILKALRRLLMLTPCVVGDKHFKLGVDCFSVPQQALEKARNTAYDLVLSDYRMPGMDGVQFLKAFRELQPHCARLILSGYADLNGLIGAINDAGISRFLSKPWNDYELVAAIAQALALRELTMENQRLADEARLAMGRISPQQLERNRLEAEEPGITEVKWGPDGSVLLDESLLDEPLPDDWKPGGH